MGKNDRRYDKRKEHKGGTYDRRSVDYVGGMSTSALKAFFITLFAIIAIGIPMLLIASGIKKGTFGKKDSSPNDYFATNWEAIPEADRFVVTETTKVSEGENGGESQENVKWEIPEEDKDYTHVIDTMDADCVTIGFAGDILFDDNYAVGNSFKKHGNTAVGVIGDSLLNRMKMVDIMMVNNEFPYSRGGSPTEGKTYTFRARPETATILNTMGVDIVGLANNHAYDYGQQAFLDTIDTLESVEVEHVGAGRNIEEASHPIYYQTENGMKIAIICATQIERTSNPDTKAATDTSPGVFRCMDDTLLLEKIREAKSKNAYVIVFIHWGTESTTELDYLQRDQAKEIVDAGANLIIGGHPHVLQKIDYVENVPVVYSLGNYIFNSKTLDTCMVVVTLHKDGTVNLQFVPAIQSDCKVNEAFGDEALRIINYMNSMSSYATIDSNGYISHR
ncbi:CapA family protein [Butyrivibrio sp. VCB2006]|uniref:CapA family protein n=1 Tax=Butyrivibrio sp. VCB2006 TaxID=1280679 RepID=UPI0018CA7F05|nr:CapA family protein [Butyrivibrio sp. VCB2006]